MIEYIKFATLPVRDQDRALAFYTQKLGFAVAQDRPFQSDLRWIELSLASARSRLWFGCRADDEPADEPSLILMTSDVKATHAALVARGVEFTLAPADAPWSPGEMFALFRDSEGNMLMLGQA